MVVRQFHRESSYQGLVQSVENWVYEVQQFAHDAARPVYHAEDCIQEDSRCVCPGFQRFGAEDRMSEA